MSTTLDDAIKTTKKGMLKKLAVGAAAVGLGLLAAGCAPSAENCDRPVESYTGLVHGEAFMDTKYSFSMETDSFELVLFRFRDYNDGMYGYDLNALIEPGDIVTVELKCGQELGEGSYNIKWNQLHEINDYEVPGN